MPSDTTYKLEVWGAEGGGSRLSGNGSSGYGGAGGYASGIISLNAGDVINIYVGGHGGSAISGLATGGWNGGGSGYASGSSEPGNGGGGATDIRINGTDLYNRVIAAGGGGGGGWYGGGSTTSGTAGGDTQGGGGGSGYVLTSSSHKPSGYSPNTRLYMTGEQNIAGNASMPNPEGGTMIGRIGDGFVRIATFLE